MSAVLIALVCVAAIIGALAGFFRKFTKTSFWGITVLFALLFERMVGTSVKKDANGYGIAVILTAIIVLLVFSAVLLGLQKLLASAVASRRKFSEYKNYDDRAESDELILNAVDNGDRREYRRQLRKKKKIKDSAGIWGVLDRIFGAVNGTFNGLVGVGAVIIFVILFADLSGISGLQSAFSSALASSSWQGLGTDVAFDLLIICTLSLSIRIGYRNGLSSSLCMFVVLGLVVAFGAAAWSIASSEAAAGAVETLKNGVLSTLAGTLGGLADTVAKAIIALVLFALSLIIIIIVAIFLPKLIDKFRENKVYNAVDGIFGTIFACAAIIGMMLVFGGVAYALSGLEFMARFNGYAKQACIGDALYACNPVGESFRTTIGSLFGGK